MVNNPITTIFFDLDGTLIDTAPDMINAINILRRQQQQASLPLSALRDYVSHGSAVLIQKAFDIDHNHPQLEPLRQQFLQIYQQNIAIHSRLFTGMDVILNYLKQRQLKWGIITNKPSWLTNPLLKALNFTQDCCCVISGDNLIHKKPHPVPLLFACRLTHTQAQHCLYIGDAQRDITAAKRAGMKSLVARFGYIEAGEQPEQWGADGQVFEAEEILGWL